MWYLGFLFVLLDIWFLPLFAHEERDGFCFWFFVIYGSLVSSLSLVIVQVAIEIDSLNPFTICEEVQRLGHNYFFGTWLSCAFIFLSVFALRDTKLPKRVAEYYENRCFREKLRDELYTAKRECESEVSELKRQHAWEMRKLKEKYEGMEKLFNEKEAEASNREATLASRSEELERSVAEHEERVRNFEKRESDFVAHETEVLSRAQTIEAQNLNLKRANKRLKEEKEGYKAKIKALQGATATNP